MTEENKKSDSLITLFETKKSLTITLLRARESLMMSFRPMLAKHNFTEQQWRVLRVLGEKGPCDAGQLATEACILAPSLSRIINTLIENNFITDTKVGFVSFIKKSQYGPASIEVKNSRINNIDTTYLLEKYSSIKINNNILKANVEKVEDLLYGKEYGKSSK